MSGIEAVLRSNERRSADVSGRGHRGFRERKRCPEAKEVAVGEKAAPFWFILCHALGPRLRYAREPLRWCASRAGCGSRYALVPGKGARQWTRAHRGIASGGTEWIPTADLSQGPSS